MNTFTKKFTDKGSLVPLKIDRIARTTPKLPGNYETAGNSDEVSDMNVVDSTVSRMLSLWRSTSVTMEKLPVPVGNSWGQPRSYFGNHDRFRFHQEDVRFPD